ncbi:MAG: pantoate--beta-alanine ligase [Pseudomonadota bacterium]|nr:pantoate--beta-alanine ligase [Pseudomonadota bacterium]
MQIIRDIGQLGSALIALRAGGHRLALVPTMGALHAGHMALVEEARRQADRAVATIFVNPLQFAAGEDLDRYPRPEEEDVRALEEAGCDLLWMPTPEQMYPPGFATSVSVSALSTRWEGEARPGHFEGVATAVAKLLSVIRPEVAVFGDKDFQQLAVIRRLVLDLGLGASVVGVPIVRDDDGLALSSRNAYLTAGERRRAVTLPQALQRAVLAIESGIAVREALDQAEQALSAAGFSKVDYIALVDALTLEPLDAPAGRMRLVAAATIGSTRLIDNYPVGMPQRQ